MITSCSKKQRPGLLTIVLVFCSFVSISQTIDGDTPSNLTCEYATNPLSIHNLHPRLSWFIQTEKRGWVQSACEVLVASDSAKLEKGSADLWSSGKIYTDQSILLSYKGKPLKSFGNCWWKVRVWDQYGKVSAWSAPAFWKMGVMEASDWKGKWITSDLQLKGYQKWIRSWPDFNMETEETMWKLGDTIRKAVANESEAPAVYMRREFYVNKKIKRATAYVCGLGLHELYINGKRVGKEYLNPAYTDYEKTVLYNTYDVTAYLQHDKNAIGVLLGNGWYNPIVPHILRFSTADYIAPPRLLMQVYIEHADGSTSMITTDNSWKYTINGPIVYNDILSGETYDANKEMPCWNNMGYKDISWKNCGSAVAPKGLLSPQQLYPVQKLEWIKAVKISKTGKGYKATLEREICGWIKIKLHGRKGQKITLRYLGAGSHTLGRYQTHCIILDGKGEKEFEPRFSYNGFREVEIDGLEEAPSVNDITGVLVATGLKKTGSFACSDKKLDEIQHILLNTITNYIVHIPNDPTREKAGWVQDVQNGFDVNAYNFDVAAMYQKWQGDFNDIVHDNGYMPPVAPGRFDGVTINGPWWGGMIIYNVAKLYRYYDDSSIVERSYAPMKRYLGYLSSIAKNNIIDWGLGEWLEPFSSAPPRPTTTPLPLTSTAAYYYYAVQMTAFAKLLHKKNDEAVFEKLATTIKQRFNEEFFDAVTGQYAQGSQASQLMPLYCGLVPAGKEALVINRLKEAIAARNGHLSTGFVATPFLLTTLSDIGLGKEAFAMAKKNDFPGWIDMIFNKGNTVMKESWDGGLVQMPSLAGPIGYWFYYSLAGIKNAAGAQAFKRIIIKPDVADSLQWVKASYESLYGWIKSEWRKTKGLYELTITIPANTTALVYLPTADINAIYEGNQPVRNYNEIHKQTARPAQNETVLKVGSGSYKFRVKQ